MRIVWFILFTILFSIPFWWLTRLGGNLFYINALMWSPALAAVIALKLTGGSLSELGWNGSRWKWLFLAWLTLVGAVIMVATIPLLFGLISFPDPQFLAEQTEKMRLPSTVPSGVVMLWYCFLAILIGAIGTGAAALGEELGWRGLLTPETQRRWGYTRSSLFVGCIWGLWHFPLMVGNVSSWYLFGFMVGIVAYSFVYGWFRLRSGSVWPSTLLHALNNALFGFYGRAFIFPPDSDPHALWVGDGGLIFQMVAIGIATICWLHRKQAAAAFQAWSSTFTQTIAV